jgi:site-specific recombinase XerD
MKKATKSRPVATAQPTPSPSSSGAVVGFYGRDTARNGWQMLYATLTQSHDGKRVRFSTGIECRKGDFDLTTFTVKRDPATDLRFQRIREQITTAITTCDTLERPVDVFAIRRQVEGYDGTAVLAPTVLEAIQRFVAHQRTRLEVADVVQRTYWKNVRWANDFAAYVEQELGKPTTLTDLRPTHVRAFVLWLQTAERGLGNHSAQRTATYSKVILDFCVESGWLTTNPFVTFKAQLPETEVQTLTAEECTKLLNLDLTGTGLDVVRDAFKFMLLTGLAYCDVAALRRHHLHQIEGQLYIIQPRQKMRRRPTSHTARVPLRPDAVALIDKYDAQEPDKPLLPLHANAAMNRSLKVLANMAGIRKRVTTKIARSTLATYLVNAGMPLASAAAMLGHKNTATTEKYYLKVDAATVGRDLQNVGDLYAPTSRKPAGPEPDAHPDVPKQTS